MDAPRSPAPFRVGRWHVDSRAGVITCADESMRIDDRALRVLARLAAAPGEVVGVDALLDAAWADVVVSPDSVYQAIATLRRALGDTAREPAYIATVPRQGYRLMAQVSTETQAAGAAESAAVAAEPVAAAAIAPEAGRPARLTPMSSSRPIMSGVPAPDAPLTPRSSSKAPDASTSGAAHPIAMRVLLPLLVVACALAIGGWLGGRTRSSQPGPTTAPTPRPDGVIARQTKPADTAQAPSPRSIAVLPFADLTDAMDKEPFADGVTEQLIESIGHLPDAHVASRTDSYAIKGTPPVAELARQLHVRWLIEGSVRKSGDRLRVTARLVRASDGEAVWSHDYDSTATDALKLQDRIADEVALVLRKTWGEAALH